MLQPRAAAAILLVAGIKPAVRQVYFANYAYTAGWARSEHRSWRRRLPKRRRRSSRLLRRTSARNRARSSVVHQVGCAGGAEAGHHRQRLPFRLRLAATASARSGP
jgi:hypothetical protein